MDQIANQNSASSSAPADNRISEQQLGTAMLFNAETPPSDVKDPDKLSSTPELDLLIPNGS